MPDGTQDGFDLDLTRAVAEEVPVPVIASGGAGKLEDFYRVLTGRQGGRGPCRVGLPLWNLPYQGSEGLSFKTRRRRAALKRGPFLITGEGPFLRLLQKARVRA